MTRKATAVHEPPAPDVGVIASTIQVGAAAANARYDPALPLAQLDESAMNPRKRFDPAGLEELTASIREKGVLTPLLARPDGNGSYEIAAGHRRYRAAKAAGLAAVPVIVREMSDAELLEVLVIENDQREDVHPLEEAAGYQALMRTAKYDVARIAARIGRSVKYVYDRVKLLALTKEAQALFLDGKFTAGHAILLARLKPEDQKRAIDPEFADSYRHDAALFTGERGLFDPDAEEDEEKRDPYAGVKPVSVREFQAWIDQHVKVDRDAVDPMLFPETAVMIGSAKEQGEKIIPIMNLAVTPDDARGAERIYSEKSWKRADGEKGSEMCDHSKLGLVSIGRGRNEAFRVCIAKEKCAVHWGAEIRERKKRQAAVASGDTKAVDRYRAQEQKRQEAYKAEQAREEAERARWDKARPAILKATAERVLKMPVKATGFLADLIITGLRNYESKKEDLVLVARGKTAEDLVRHAAFLVLAARTRGYRAQADFTKVARGMGLDVGKIVDEAAPEKVQTSAVKKAVKKGGKL